MNKLKIIIIALIIMIFSTNLFAIDYEQSKIRAKESVLSAYHDKIDKVAIFMADKLVEKSDEVILKDYHHQNLDIPFDNSIMIFVDLMPEADWGHPCEYIFINPETNKKYVYHTMFPFSQGYKYEFKRINEITKKEKSLYFFKDQFQKEINRLQKLPKPIRTDDNKYTILISGGVSRAGNFERYYNNIKLMYNTLISNYGYPEDNVYVFFAGGAIPAGSNYIDGTDTHQDNAAFVEVNTGSWSVLNAQLRSSDLDGDGDCDISNSARINHVENLIDGDLKTDLDVETANKSLFIYTYDHGGNSTYDGGNNADVNNEVDLCMWDEDWDDDDFVDKIDQEPYRSLNDLNITMHQCFSGGFKDEIESSQLTNIVFTAAANYYEVGYSGTQQKYAQRWVLSSSGRNFSDVDTNNNSELELLEIHNYTEDHIDNLDTAPDIPTQNKQKQHPQIYSKPANQSSIARLGDFSSYSYHITGILNYEDESSSLIPLFNPEIRLYHTVLGVDLECGNGVHYSEQDGTYETATNTEDNVFIKIKLQNEFVRALDDDLISKNVFEYKSDSIETSLGYNLLNFVIDNITDNYQACNLFNVIANSQRWFGNNLLWERYKVEPPLQTPNPDRIDLIWIGSNAKDTNPGFYPDDDYLGIEDENLWNTTYLNYNYCLANIYNTYNYEWPTTSYTGETGLNKVTDEGMALRNGLAWFLTAAIADDPDAVQFNVQNIETNTWWQGDDPQNPNENGRIVEGAIASFFWDLYDNAKESGDNVSGKVYEIWHIFTEYNPQDIGDFIAHWNYEDLFSVEQLNHIVFDTNISILSPQDGYPLIVNFDNLDPITIAFIVKDAQGDYIHSLTIDNFTVEIGHEVCNKNILQEQEDPPGEWYYLLEVEPIQKDEIGVYHLEVIFNEIKHITSSDMVLCGVLYTYQPLIESGLAWLKEKQNANGSWNYGWSNNAGITALALQSFLAAGYNINSVIYGNTIESAIDYIINTQQTSGYHLGGIANSQYGYETAMCIVALNSALKTELPSDLTIDIQDALDLALNYYTQDVQESWNAVSWRYNRGYTSEYSGDMSVNQWTYLALEAMGYTEKDIWTKIYTYIDNKKSTSDNKAWVGYQSPGTRPRGNTMAATWGLNIAAGHGINGASALADKCYNYITEGYTVNSLISASDLHGSCVYSGGGYYYYIYELAKAFALGGRIQINGENWYETLFNRIDGQHQEEDNLYYWFTGFTDPTGYYIQSGGLGNHGNTALALLALQVGTVPPDSRFVISLVEDGSKDGLQLVVYDGDGNFAGINEYGVWITEIPNSQWISTGTTKQLEIELTTAANITVEIYNTGDVISDYDLNFEAYVGDNISDEVHYSGSIESNQILGTTANINAIGGLTIYTSPPETFPNMELSLSSKTFHGFTPGMQYEFDFEVMEVGGEKTIYDIDIYASDLEDGLGNLIPRDSLVFEPAHIDSIVYSSSDSVHCIFTLPQDVLTDHNYTGKIYAEASGIGRKSFDIYLLADSLYLAKTDDTDGIPAVPGTIIRYTIIYGNPLTFPLYNVDIFDELPDSLISYQNCSDDGIYNTTNNTVSWHFDEIPAGEIDQNIWVDVKVNQNLIDTATIFNYCSIHSDLPTITKFISTKLAPASKEPYFSQNPFNPDDGSGTFYPNFDDPLSPVKIKIYDVSNQLVAELDGNTWDGKNEVGDIVANGVYFCIVENDAGEKAIIKVAVLR